MYIFSNASSPSPSLCLDPKLNAKAPAPTGACGTVSGAAAENKIEKKPKLNAKAPLPIFFEQKSKRMPKLNGGLHRTNSGKSVFF